MCEAEQERGAAEGRAVEVADEGAGEVEAAADLAKEGEAEGEPVGALGGSGDHGVGGNGGAGAGDGGDVEAGRFLAQPGEGAGRGLVVGGRDDEGAGLPRPRQALGCRFHGLSLARTVSPSKPRPEGRVLACGESPSLHPRRPRGWLRACVNCGMCWYERDMLAPRH